VYLTLYFQLLGMTDFAASMLMALLLGSTAVGGLLGGWVGDKAASRYPDHGRILVCQFSVAVGIPFSLTITKVHPAPLLHLWQC
jgi:MFS family permease